jgi:hypothetical protein
MMGHGETVDEAVKAAKLAGEDKPVLLKMPLPNVGIAAQTSPPLESCALYIYQARILH